METVNYVTGAFIIILGFLVKVFPNLIAGYNTLPKPQKQKTDVQGLSSLVRNCTVLIGLIICVGNFFLRRYQFNIAADSLIIISIMTIIPIMLFKARKYNQK